MSMKQFSLRFCAVLLVTASTAAFANDQITSTVSSSTPPAVIVNNGVASGTIQLGYTYVGSSLPCGTSPFATFNLGLVDTAGTNGQAPSYPVTLNLAQSGNGTPVQLTPSPATFSVSGPGWSGSSSVSVYINCANLAAAGAPFDGQEIVGNLNESTDPSGSHLETISTIQVHITLAIPSASACLKLYSFQTDQDSGALLNSVSVTANKKNGSFTTVKSTNPGTLSVDGLVVNTCTTSQSFDLNVGLDPNWGTIPSNSAGNATFTYSAYTGDIDLSSFNLLASGIGTPAGEALCLQNVSLPVGDSFLATVHSAINSGISVSSLPLANFTFQNTLKTATTAPTLCGTGTPLPTTLVSPTNPAISLLPYTVH